MVVSVRNGECAADKQSSYSQDEMRPISHSLTFLEREVKRVCTKNRDLRDLANGGAFPANLKTNPA